MKRLFATGVCAGGIAAIMTEQMCIRDSFVICILCFFQFAGTQILSHHNADAGTKLEINDVEQIGDGCSNVKPGNYFQAADRVALYYGLSLIHI